MEKNAPTTIAPTSSTNISELDLHSAIFSLIYGRSQWFALYSQLITYSSDVARLFVLHHSSWAIHSIDSHPNYRHSVSLAQSDIATNIIQNIHSFRSHRTLRPHHKVNVTHENDIYATNVTNLHAVHSNEFHSILSRCFALSIIASFKNPEFLCKIAIRSF